MQTVPFCDRVRPSFPVLIKKKSSPEIRKRKATIYYANIQIYSSEQFRKRIIRMHCN